MRPLAIDLFTGLHGWSAGLVAEGFDVIGVDLEDMCGQFNQPRPPHVHLVIQDVRTLHGSQFKDAALIVASPPCQEFSYMAMPWKRSKQIARALRATQFAAAEAQESAPPIRPMSVGDRAALGSSSGGESCVLGRAEGSKHGQPRRSLAHGSDAGGNPTKLGAPIERVEGPQPEFPAGYTGSRTVADLTRLFDACFRIQREACEAAGRHIPLIVENVKGAQPWVGRARWAFGSFYLWGDVPALMPTALRAQKFNPDGTSHPPGSWFAVADSRNRGAGGSWFGIAHNKASGLAENPRDKLASGQKVVGGIAHIRDGFDHTRHLTNPAEHQGVKHHAGGEVWFDTGPAAFPSSSAPRRFASAMIAKIPLPLSRHIGVVFYPREAKTA